MPVSSPDKPDLLTTTEAALVAQVSTDKIRRAVRSGELPAQRAGDRYLVSRAAVEEWARKQRDEGGPRE